MIRTTAITFLILISTTKMVVAANQGTLNIENRSSHSIKLVAPGKALILPKESAAKTHTFEQEDPLGVHLNIWWKHNPREFCRLFTPWSRSVLISGTHTIKCLSKNL